MTGPAGGGVDTVTRIFAERLQQKLGQPFVIENRGGAGGNVGAEQVYASAPDGYTLMASQPAPLTTNVALYKKLNFDPAALEPVAVMSKFPNVLLVRQDFPAKTGQEFVAYAKANPGKLNYASQGVGTTSHLTAELFMALTGTKLTHVPYRGTGPALNDIIASHVDFIFMELSSAVKLHESQKARILAVATDKRLDILKDIPTMIEVGVPGFISTPERDQRAAEDAGGTHRQAQRGDQRDHQRARYQAAVRGAELLAAGGSTDDMRKLIQEETKRWGEVIRKAGFSRNRARPPPPSWPKR